MLTFIKLHEIYEFQFFIKIFLLMFLKKFEILKISKWFSSSNSNRNSNRNNIIIYKYIDNITCIGKYIIVLVIVIIIKREIIFVYILLN